MNFRLAQILSYLLHPVIFPIIGVFVTLKILPYHINSAAVILSMVFVFTGTYILPMVFSLLMFKFGSLSSLEMRSASERKWPYLIGATFYFITASLLKYLNLPVESHLFLTASALTIMLHLICLPFFKPSAHMAAMGGFTALLIAISLRYQINLIPYLALMIILSGFLASARLKLEAHGFKELIFGYVSGFLIVFISLLFAGTV